MKKIYNIVIIFILTVFYGYSQENKFERKLQLFYFSLNEVLEKYDDEKIYKLNFNKDDTLISVINRFVYENKQEIKKYRETVLKEYTDNFDILFDTTKYEKIDLSEINKHLNSADLNKSIPLLTLMLINPLKATELYTNFYFSGHKNPKELAIYKAKRSITYSLIKTHKLDNNRWQIIENSYDIICKFIYNTENGKIINFEVFERKQKK